jgi:hypothetical protein
LQSFPRRNGEWRVLSKFPRQILWSCTDFITWPPNFGETSFNLNSAPAEGG